MAGTAARFSHEKQIYIYATYGTRKKGPLEKNPRINGPRKNVLKKLFSVKRMLGNLNDFLIFID